MSADSYHHQIEEAMRKMTSLHDFFDFLSCVECAQGGKAKVKEMAFSDFYEWADHSHRTKIKNHHLRPMVAIEGTRGSFSLRYKTDHDGEYQVLNFLYAKSARKGGIPMPVSRSTPKGISAEKKNEIITKLLPLMPENKRLFWKFIATSDEPEFDLEAYLSLSDENEMDIP